MSTCEHDRQDDVCWECKDDQIATLERDLAAVREWLWLNHGCPIAGLYGDDGEMQCGQGHVEDYKRAPLLDILKRQFERTQRDLAAAKRMESLLQQFSQELGTALHLRGDGTLNLSEAVQEKFREKEADLTAAQARLAILEEADRAWDKTSLAAIVRERDELKKRIAALTEALESPALLEQLSALEHERWAGWMSYQAVAPSHKVADWPRKVVTPYMMLTEDEKESDRIEARKTLAVIRATLTAAKETACSSSA